MPTMRPPSRRIAWVACVLLLLPACGGGGGSAAPTITGPATPLPIGILGVAYAQTFSATGAAPTWSVGAGTLTPGLALDAGSGTLTGVPTEIGTFAFTVTATNGAGADSRACTHSVHGPLPVTEVEGNGAPATASAATLGVPAQGSLAAPGDVDVWSVALSAGQDVEIEVFSTRRDPETWDASGNRAVATLLAPDGTSVLVTTEPTIGTGLDQDVARFRVPSTGIHFLELRTAVPASAGGPYAFTIRALTLSNPQVEAEPNDGVATATAIVPGTVFATHASGDEDFYAFAVTEPTIVRFETFAHRNGASGVATGRFDPILDLVDATGTTVLKSRDDGIFFDTVFAYLLEEPGTYTLRVRSFGGAGDAGDYFLHFEAVPATGVAEVEPNPGAPGASNPLAVGSLRRGSVSSGDDDVFTFDGTAGDLVHLQLLALSTDVQGATALVEPVTTILEPNGVTVVPSSGPGPSQRIRRTILTTTGTFFVRVSTSSATPTPYALRLSIPQTSSFEHELNDTVASAEPLPEAGRISGTLDGIGDVDVFAFPAVAGELVVLSLLGSVADASNADLDGWGSTIVPRLDVLDAASALLVRADDLAPVRKPRGTISGLYRVEAAFVAPSTGTFYAQVRDVGSTPTPHYTLVKR